MMAGKTAGKALSRLWPSWICSSKRHYANCIDPCPQKKLMDLKCKTAFITGGTSGIGLAIADSLLACGLQKAVISGQDVRKGNEALNYLLRQHGQGRAEFKELNVTNQKMFEDVFKSIILKEGNVDILVNNAGFWRDNKWEETIDVNLKGVVRGALLANKYMPSQKNKGGCVVNVASVVGFDVFPLSPIYSATKHAVVGLTKCFGDEKFYSKTKVRHIALCPGLTVTNQVDFTGKQNKYIDEGLKGMSLSVLNSMPLQTPAPVGNGTVYMVEYGPPGSLWTVENAILSRVYPPKYDTYKKKVMDI